MKHENLTESQKKSAYFSMDDAYDKDVYENDAENWFKIVGMLTLFYTFNGLHWWANHELSTSDAETSTIYNLIIFGVAVTIIAVMLICGSFVNKKIITHEFYNEKISEEKQRKAEQDAKDNAKAAKQF